MARSARSGADVLGVETGLGGLNRGVPFEQGIDQGQVKIADPESVLGLLRQIPKMFVFIEPLLWNLSDGPIGKFDIALAARHRFAEIMQ